jgi:hypothetical protein
MLQRSCQRAQAPAVIRNWLALKLMFGKYGSS